MTHKKYLYAMRGLINAKWVMEKNSIPPIDFNNVVDEVSVDTNIVNKLKEIIKIKRFNAR